MTPTLTEFSADVPALAVRYDMPGRRDRATRLAASYERARKNGMSVLDVRPDLVRLVGSAEADRILNEEHARTWPTGCSVRCARCATRIEAVRVEASRSRSSAAGMSLLEWALIGAVVFYGLALIGGFALAAHEGRL